MSMNVVTDCLNAAPSRWRLPKEIPRRLGQPIGFAIPAPEQEDKRVLGQVRHGNLLRLGNDDVGESSVVDERIGRDARAALGRNNAGAPVAKVVTIGCDRDRRVDHQVVTADQIGHAAEVDVEVEYHRGWLRAVVDHFEADVNLHLFSPWYSPGEVAHGWRRRWWKGFSLVLLGAGRESWRAQAAHAVRNESISTRRNAVQRRPAAKTMPWLTSSSIPT